MSDSINLQDLWVCKCGQISERGNKVCLRCLAIPERQPPPTLAQAMRFLEINPMALGRPINKIWDTDVRHCPKCNKELLFGTYCADCFAICLACHALRPKAEACPDCGHVPLRDPEDAGLKFDANKLRLDLLPIEALEEMSKVYAFGVKKYSAHNWRKGMQWSRLFAACLRHMFAWHRGETYDQESGLNHLVHAAFCIMCLITFEKTHPEKDDRPIENKE